MVSPLLLAKPDAAGDAVVVGDPAISAEVDEMPRDHRGRAPNGHSEVPERRRVAMLTPERHDSKKDLSGFACRGDSILCQLRLLSHPCAWPRQGASRCVLEPPVSSPPYRTSFRVIVLIGYIVPLGRTSVKGCGLQEPFRLQGKRKGPAFCHRALSPRFDPSQHRGQTVVAVYTPAAVFSSSFSGSSEAAKSWSR